MKKYFSRKILIVAALLFAAGTVWQVNNAGLAAKAPEKSSEKSDIKSQEKGAKRKVTKDGFLVLEWFDLLPPGYDPDSLYKKYADKINKMTDEDPAVMQLLEKLRYDLDNTPLNQDLHEKMIRMPGFVAGLDNSGKEIREFLLVPYFGACIHSPPPPQNQTVLVIAKKGKGIPADKSFSPFWVKGKILVQGKNTDMGKAGYTIIDAETEPYTDKMPGYEGQ